MNKSEEFLRDRYLGQMEAEAAASREQHIFENPAFWKFFGFIILAYPLVVLAPILIPVVALGSYLWGLPRRRARAAADEVAAQQMGFENSKSYNRAAKARRKRLGSETYGTLLGYAEQEHERLRGESYFKDCKALEQALVHTAALSERPALQGESHVPLPPVESVRLNNDVGAPVELEPLVQARWVLTARYALTSRLSQASGYIFGRSLFAGALLFLAGYMVVSHVSMLEARWAQWLALIPCALWASFGALLGFVVATTRVARNAAEGVARSIQGVATGMAQSAFEKAASSSVGVKVSALPEVLDRFSGALLSDERDTDSGSGTDDKPGSKPKRGSLLARTGQYWSRYLVGRVRQRAERDLRKRVQKSGANEVSLAVFQSVLSESVGALAAGQLLGRLRLIGAAAQVVWLGAVAVTFAMFYAVR